MLNYYQIIFLTQQGEAFRLKAWGKDHKDAVRRLPKSIKERAKRLGVVRYRWRKLR